VADVQTKIDDIFMLHIDTRLTFDEIARIYLKGRSRVPVYEGDPAAPPQVNALLLCLLLPLPSAAPTQPHFKFCRLASFPAFSC
jgi:hypothetical protein